MTDDPTTDRAQRRQAVASGARDTGIEAVDRRSPGAGLTEGTSRSRQLDMQRDIAGEIGVDRGGVATTDRVGGMNAFLRSSGTQQFAANLRSDFASAADFVREGDVDPNVDPQAISADPVVAPGRRDDVAARARSETASDAEYITPADLRAEVGARGVNELQVAENRRDDVAQRTREGLASEDPFAQPGDFEATVTGRGIESAGLTDQGAERRASRQFEAETPLRDVDTDDVTATEGGFGLDTEAQRRAAAREFESDLSIFGSGELDPSSDIRDTDSGFGLAAEPAREVAAAELSEQVDGDVTPGDIELEPADGGGFEAIFERGGR